MFKNRGSFSLISHRHDTRLSNSLGYDFQRLTLTQQSINYAGPKLWNEIPTYLKESTSVHAFEKKFKSFILSSYGV